MRGGTSAGTGELMLGGTSGDGRNREISSSKFSKYPPKFSSSSPTVVRVWVGSSSIPSYYTSIPMADDVAGLHTWSDILWGSGSELMACSALFFVMGTSSGSGIHSVQLGWLGSGLGCVPDVRVNPPQNIQITIVCLQMLY